MAQVNTVGQISSITTSLHYESEISTGFGNNNLRHKKDCLNEKLKGKHIFGMIKIILSKRTDMMQPGCKNKNKITELSGSNSS